MREGHGRRRSSHTLALTHSPRARDLQPDASRSKGGGAPLCAYALSARERSATRRVALRRGRGECSLRLCTLRARDIDDPTRRAEKGGESALLRSSNSHAREIGAPIQRGGE